MTILSLPSTTDDVLLDELSPAELFKYGRTCKSLRSIVQSYMRRRFQLDKLLEKYFTPQEIQHFRQWQALTGMLISGSTALQFFNRVVYPDSDLDLYVAHPYREGIGLWLLAIGYRYVPHPKSDIKTFADALLHLDMDPMLLRAFLLESRLGYLESECVFTFVKQNPYRKVQMILSLNSPLERILSFHSTCVMNIITHDTAYSFFPRGTFEEQRALSCVSRTDINILAQKKYENRGWSISQYITRDEFDDPTFAFARGLRYVGDAQCWTFPITSKPDALSMCNIESNSWLMEYDQHLSLKMTYKVVNSPNLRSTYLIERDDEHLQRHLQEEFCDPDSYNESEEREPFLDAKFTSFIDWYRAGHYASNTCDYAWPSEHDTS